MSTYLDLPSYQQRSVSEVREIRYGLLNGGVLSLLLWTAIMLALVVR